MLKRINAFDAQTPNDQGLTPLHLVVAGPSAVGKLERERERDREG
jgi:hypothetical protein